jgi:poly-gamma-glutamate synthase PgsB/CapB
MIVLMLSVAGYLLYLVYERVTVDRWRKSVPQAIIVTGTRGKSSVTRILASVLKADGREVLAKTTGSLPKLMWPDGSETEIKRRGPASILEQKTLLERAANLNVDCVVVEAMSIHPESHIVESQQMLKPDIVVVTNTWPDHVDAQGQTEDEVAATLCLGIREEATVVVPSSCRSPVFETAARMVNGRLVAVDQDVSTSIRQRVPKIATTEFSENIDLVYGVAKYLGVEDEVIANGLATVKPDAGALTIREFRAGAAEKRLFLVNAFAANDPTSTFRVLAKAKELLPEASQVVGLLCLRSDRADRTSQWIEALGSSLASEFNRIYATGGHSRVVARKLRTVEHLKGMSAEHMTASIMAEAEEGSAVFGFGNYVGVGSQLAEHWSRVGVAYGL